MLKMGFVVQSLSHVWLCEPMNCSTPGFPVLHHLPELTQTYVLWVSDAIQLSHPLLPPSPLAFSLSQHQGLFQRIGSSNQVAKVLERQLQHQSFQTFQGRFPLRLTGLILLSKGLYKSLLHHHSSKATIFQCSASFLQSNSHIPTGLLEKP